MAYMLTIKGRKPVRCATLAEASATYAGLRDRSGRGASSWPTGAVVGQDGATFTISYNGRVWTADGRDALAMATITVERDSRYTWRTGVADFLLHDGFPPLRLARLVRVRPVPGMFGEPGTPRGWEVWDREHETELRFQRWPEAKAALREALRAA